MLGGVAVGIAIKRAPEIGGAVVDQEQIEPPRSCTRDDEVGRAFGAELLELGDRLGVIPRVVARKDSAGVLLLKLDSSGNIEWQKTYNGGIYCYFNGFNQTCVIITALAYSVHQTADGGYVLAGLGQLELLDSVPQVPWLAKFDSAGNLLWQYFYYDLYSTGRPISQYFASSTPTMCSTRTYSG